MVSPLESNVDPPIPGSVKVSHSGGGEEFLLANRVLFRWCPDFLYGQRFEVNPRAVALLTILVVRLDAQTVFFCSDIRNSAVEPRYNNHIDRQG